MKFIFAALIALFSVSNIAKAQGDDWRQLVKLSYSIKKIDDSHGELVITGKIVPGFHVYAVAHDPAKADLTGSKPYIMFTSKTGYKTVGSLYDGIKPKTVNDYSGTSQEFLDKMVLKQKFEATMDKPFSIEGRLNFQVCDENGCKFAFDDFSIKVTDIVASAEVEVDTPEVDSSKKTSVVPEKEGTKEKKNGTKSVKQTKKGKKSESQSWWTIFFAGFGGGLFALLTPCMFPMIPMTVTFFTKQSKTRREGIIKALIYGISIIVIYVAIGLIITALLGPTGLQELSTNAIMNLIFFAIFMVFAFSFLGAFEIRLPNSWLNKADKGADKGGLIGIFFMAFTLGLVSFSCTGPIIGTLLVEAASSGSVMAPAMGMTGFATALAIPFMLFAIFPGWLNSLPQSGGWLNSVKVVLGLLEIALAMKFLSGVDLAYHWDIITREVFVAIWIVIFAIIGFYLLGKIRFSHDSPVEQLSVTRFMFALISLVFTVYLIPGMWGAPLLMIDGVAPPRTHSEDGFRFNKGESTSAVAFDPVRQEYAKHMHDVGDGSIQVFHDLEIAKEYAKKVNKPILIDFTGYNCANCRKTESTVWTSDEVRPILQNDYVIASLYTDDRTELPASEQKYSKAIQGKMLTVGNKWADLSVRRYKQNTQPLYVIVDVEGNDISEPIPYTPDIKEYQKFLEKGLKQFK